jgi:DNA topoisomerase-1
VNGSHGLTTLKDKHVKIAGPSITFSFTGKKGVSHNISLHNKKLAKLVKHCREIPGKELFQYLAPDGTRKKIDSGMVNNYIREISGKQFSAKDFRTWAGTVNALEKIQELDQSDRLTDSAKTINEIIDYVSLKLGNTRSVCKKYYIHPVIFELVENYKQWKTHDSNPGQHPQLSSAEVLLMKILKKESRKK